MSRECDLVDSVDELGVSLSRGGGVESGIKVRGCRLIRRVIKSGQHWVRGQGSTPEAFFSIER